MRRELPWVVGVVVAVSLAACGGGGDDDDVSPAPPPTRDAEVRAAAVSALQTFDADRRCRQVLTERLVVRIYGDVDRCVRVLDEGMPDISAQASVVAATVDGSNARTRVALTTGDGDRVAGTLMLRYERGGWRVDGFDADLLRGQLGADVAGHLEATAASERDEIQRCVRRGADRMSDAAVTRLAYTVLGARRAGLTTAYRRLARCTSGNVSLLRHAFERLVREGLDGIAPRRLECVLRGLRVIVSDDNVIDVLASGSIDSRAAERRLAGPLARAAAACDLAPGSLVD